MALTQLSDVQFDDEVYASYLSEMSVISTSFLNGGIIETNPLLNERANSPSRLTEIPAWKALDSSVEPNYSDDSETPAVPQKILTSLQTARVAHLNEAWKSADLIKEINGAEPMRAIANSTNRYWQEQLQTRVFKSLNGIKADNVANDSGDMVNDIAIEDGDAATAANLISRAAVTATQFTSGDRYDSYGAMAMHSVVYNRLVDNDDIDFIPDSQGTTRIPTYLGLNVIVNDNLQVVAGGTSGFKYTSVFFGGAAIGFGSGMPKNPVEIEREALQGLGGGTETLVERNTWLLHPLGFAWTDSSVAGASPAWSELEAAANWNRVYERKNIPLAFLVTNG